MTSTMALLWIGWSGMLVCGPAPHLSAVGLHTTCVSTPMPGTARPLSIVRAEYVTR